MKRLGKLLEMQRAQPLLKASTRARRVGRKHAKQTIRKFLRPLIIGSLQKSDSILPRLARITGAAILEAKKGRAFAVIPWYQEQGCRREKILSLQAEYPWTHAGGRPPVLLAHGDLANPALPTEEMSTNLLFCGFHAIKWILQPSFSGLFNADSIACKFFLHEFFFEYILADYLIPRLRGSKSR